MEEEFERYLSEEKQKAWAEGFAESFAKRAAEDFSVRVYTVVSILDASHGQPLSDDLIRRIINALLNPVQSPQDDT